MATEVTTLLNSDSEEDDPAPFMLDASLVAGWQRDPNAGASACQPIDLGDDSGEDEAYSVAGPVSDAKVLSDKDAAPGVDSHGNGNGNTSNGSGSSDGDGDGDGVGSLDIRSESSSSGSSSSSGGGSHQVHGVTGGHGPVVDVRHTDLPGGGDVRDAHVGLGLGAAIRHVQAQIPFEGQQAAAMGKLPLDLRRDGHETSAATDEHESHQETGEAGEKGEGMREETLKGGNHHHCDSFDTSAGAVAGAAAGGKSAWEETLKVRGRHGGDSSGAGAVGGIWAGRERENGFLHKKALKVGDHHEGDDSGGGDGSGAALAGKGCVARGKGMRRGTLNGRGCCNSYGSSSGADALAEAGAGVGVEGKDKGKASCVADATEASKSREGARGCTESPPTPTGPPASEQPHAAGVAAATSTAAVSLTAGTGLALIGRHSVAGDDVASEGSKRALAGSSSASGQPTAPPSAAESIEAIIDALPPGFVKCPGCPMVYELVPNEDAARGGRGGVVPKELPKGANLSRRSAMRHNGRHRFRCPSCSTCFCGSCRAAPYHIGFDCEGWRAHQAKPKCNYCGDVAEEPVVADGDGDTNEGENGREVGARVPCCGAEECRARANEGCRKKLSCGHSCRGPGGADCLPCIETGCPSAEVDGNDYCNICWTEALLAAPCVKLECGHFVHVSCGLEQLKRGRSTARLTFGFMSCPVCRADKVLATHPHLGKCEGIPEQLDLAHEVEELAIQRLRADELPPLQRSLESLQADMRRRMAGLARHRHVDGNWRARGRAGPFPLQMPYPPMPGYQPPMRVRGAAAAVAGVGGAGGARAHPMYPRPLLQGAALGDWQPLVRMGMDFPNPPYGMPPAPYALNHMAAVGGPAGAASRAVIGRGAAGRLAAVGPGGAGGQSGAGHSQQQPLSKEEYLDRKRQMLIAQADVAMKRAVGVAGRIPGAGRARGSAAYPPGARERSHLVRERLEQQLEKGKAVLEERRRARRDVTKELEEFPLSDGFSHRSRRSQLAAGDRPNGIAAGAKEENAQEVERQPQRQLPLPVHGLDRVAPARKPEPGHLAEVVGLEAPPALSRRPRMRRLPRNRPYSPPEVLDIDVGNGVDGKKAMGIWGWGDVANQVVGGEAAAVARAAEQPSHDSQAAGRDEKAVVFSDMTAKSASNSDSEAHENSELHDMGVGHPGIGDSDLGRAASAPGASVDGDRGKLRGVEGDKNESAEWLDVLQWPLRSLSSLGARRGSRHAGEDDEKEREEEEEKEGERAKKGSRVSVMAAAAPVVRKRSDADDDDVVVLDEGEGDFGFSPPSSKRRCKWGPRGGVSFHGRMGKRHSDFDFAPPYFEGGRRRVERSFTVKRRRVPESDADSEDTPEPSPKRVAFDGGRVDMGNWRREFDEQWSELDRALARVETGEAAAAGSAGKKREDSEASGIVADSAIAARGEGGGAGGDGAGGKKIWAAVQEPRGAYPGRNRDTNARALPSAGAGAAAPSGVVRSGMRGGGVIDSGRSSNPPAVDATMPAAEAAAAVAGAAPEKDTMKGKGGEAGAGSAPDSAVLAATVDTKEKEKRAEMVARALKKYSYYQCYSCRKPYYGGLVNCEPGGPPAGGASVGGGGGAAERALADIKPQELLCGKCSAASGGASCSEHGQEFMEHKCYWCCEKVASYFCGGVMHFCDVCHLHGFAAKPKPCLGGARCLFGGQHPDKAKNGENEYVLGCGLCRPKPEETETTGDSGAASGGPPMP